MSDSPGVQNQTHMQCSRIGGSRSSRCIRAMRHHGQRLAGPRTAQPCIITQECLLTYKQSPWHEIDALGLTLTLPLTQPHRKACGRRRSCCTRASWR